MFGVRGDFFFCGSSARQKTFLYLSTRYLVWLAVHFWLEMIFSPNFGELFQSSCAAPTKFSFHQIMGPFICI